MLSIYWALAIAVASLGIGAVLAGFWGRARQEIQIERARSELAGELASVRERASRAPVLEAQVSNLLAAEQASQVELLRLSTLEAGKSQLLLSTTEQLKDGRAQLTLAERQLAEFSAQLGTTNERRATLESEVSRIPGLEARLALTDVSNADLNKELTSLKESLGRFSAELKAQRDSLATSQSELSNARRQLEDAQATNSQLAVEKADLATRLDAERKHTEEKLQLLNEAKQVLSDQFKALANEILEEKSRRFTEQNQTNLGQLLDPLKLKLSEFQAKVEDVYVKETKDRSALASRCASS